MEPIHHCSDDPEARDVHELVCTLPGRNGKAEVGALEETMATAFSVALERSIPKGNEIVPWDCLCNGNRETTTDIALLVV